MYNTTTALAAALAAKRLNLKAACGSTTLEGNQIANCTYSASIGGSDALTIGGVTAAMVTLTINQEVAWRDKTIAVSVGAEVDGAIQYVPLGTFAVTDCKQAEGTTTITAYDAAYYALGGTYTPAVSSGATVAAVLSDVATQCGLTLATLPAAASTTSVVGDLTEKTCRDMVGYLAALVGCNALIDRDGKLALRWFAASGQSYSPSDYYNAGLSIDGTSTLACIRAEVEMTTTDADGNTSVTTNAYTAGGTGVGVTIQNPYMTQAILDAVWASIGGLAYTVGSCDIFHGLLTEPGDLVTITDKAGVAHTLAVMSLTMTIDGGCKTTLRATGESTTDAGAAMQGSLGGKVSQLVVDLAKMKQLIIEGPDGVTRLYGGRIDTKSLFAQNITATGTITGAQLIGAILSGDAIDIQAETGNERLRLGTSVNAETNASAISMSVKDTQSNASAEVTVNAVGVTMDGVQLDLLGEWIAIGDANVASETEFYGHVVLPGGNLEDKDYSSTKHTNFSGSVISSGSVVVTKKLGVCYVSGAVTLSKSISAWTTILSGSKVPAPQHGELVPFEASQWGTSYVRPLRGKITPSGGLQLVYGAAGNYVFTIAYPID